MTLDVTGYTVAANQPLNHARILWDDIQGTVTATGDGGSLAANDYTFQRWALGDGVNTWELTSAFGPWFLSSGVWADAGIWVDDESWDLSGVGPRQVDTVFISAHNLAGCSVTIATSPDLSTPYTDHVTVLPSRNDTLAVMLNNNGVPYAARRLRITVTGGAGRFVGIIRAGVALQMQQPFYGGHRPVRLNRVTEGQQQYSEGGQWIGRTEKRKALSTSYNWTHLSAPWYRANFEPFARTLPLKPFGIIGNPARMPDDVAWCWTNGDPAPSNMGITNLMQVSMDVTGFYE